MNRLVLSLVGVVALGWTGAAQAQCALGANFDACMSSQLGAMQQQNAMGQQQLWNQYLLAYGPMLQQEYQAWGHQTGASFDQFAYYMLMSANGTNIQGAVQAQRDQFLGNQAAHNSQVEGGQTLIDGMQANSDRTLGAVENNEVGAVRGDIVINGPNGPVELPYSGVQVGQRVDANGYSYMMTQQGYAVWDGYSWRLLQ